jgi:uncharacterized membrane protein YeaQ/YmgE (transglycosylase-associated protein family)
MHMSCESPQIILMVGLIAGWLAGQMVQGGGFGIVGDLLMEIAGAFIGSWLLPQLRLTSARALSRRSSTPSSGRCYCCWSSGSFVAEAAGEGVGAELGEDVGGRSTAEQSFGGSLEGRAFLEGRHGNVELSSALPTGSRVGLA